MLRWLFNYLKGYAILTVQGSFPERFLNLLALNGIPFWNLQRKKQVLRLRLSSRNLKTASEIAESSGIPILCEDQRGALVSLRTFKGRAILLACMSLAAGLLLFSNLIILRIEVQGNQSVSDQEILSALREEGITIGTFRKDVKSQWLKPRVMLKIPELSWIYINTSGSIATVNVRERIQAPEVVDEDLIEDVRATKTGIVKKLLVYSGTPCVKVGDTVLKGDVLISSRMVSRQGTERYVHARGSVSCDTWYSVTLKLPLKALEKQYTGRKSTTYCLISSGKRINLSIASGISYTFYDKIRSGKVITLPGGYPLPFEIEKTTLREYELRETLLDSAAVESAARAALTDLLESTVENSGTITSVRWDSAISGNTLTLKLYAQCFEEITG